MQAVRGVCDVADVVKSVDGAVTSEGELALALLDNLGKVLVVGVVFVGGAPICSVEYGVWVVAGVMGWLMMKISFGR